MHIWVEGKNTLHFTTFLMWRGVKTKGRSVSCRTSRCWSYLIGCFKWEQVKSLLILWQILIMRRKFGVKRWDLLWLGIKEERVRPRLKIFQNHLACNESLRKKRKSSSLKSARKGSYWEGSLEAQWELDQLQQTPLSKLKSKWKHKRTMMRLSKMRVNARR